MQTAQTLVSPVSQAVEPEASRLPVVLAWLAVLMFRGLALAVLASPLILAAWLLHRVA